MWVVKIGGSLSHDPALREWLTQLWEVGGGRVVIVPGGGDFADTVRQYSASGASTTSPPTTCACSRWRSTRS